MAERKGRSLSTHTWIAVSAAAILLLGCNFLAPYIHQPAQGAVYGWPLANREVVNAGSTAAATQWNEPCLIVDLFVTLILTVCVAVLVEWMARGGKLPHFSLISLLFATLIAGVLMYANSFASSTSTERGWPFTIAGGKNPELEGLGLLGNIVVGLVFTLFGGLLCEYALRIVEDIRDYHREHSGEMSWLPFAQDLQEKRKQERESKTSSPEADAAPREPESKE